MFARAVIVCVLLVGTGTAVERAVVREPRVSRASLGEMPLQIAQWRGYDAAPLADDVVATLGVDDYINRKYERDGRPVALYVGYYPSQRSGETIHSPQNCLPGAGWLPVASGRQRISLGSTSVVVTRYEIVKGLDRQVVLYWYQGRGRIVAGEYANKAWLMLDAARSGRSNGGLVRLIAPVLTTSEQALSEVSSFASALLPYLPGYLP
jgi:EpsI family protein